MTHGHQHPYQKAAGYFLLTIAGPLLWWVTQTSGQTVIETSTFIFLHTVVEICAVVVALLIFVTGYRSMFSTRRGAVVLLGIAFLGVGLLDILHTLSYVGMPAAITVNSSQKSIFFWLAARLLAAVALLSYAWLPAGPEVSVVQKRSALALMLVVVAALALIGLLWADKVPALFVPGQGLTDLKVGLEWVIIAINLTTLAVLWVRRVALARESVMALGFVAALSAVSELFFTMLGILDKDGANAVGHIYKVAAYLYLFHATFNEAMRRPLELLQAQHLREKVVLNASPDGVLWVDGAGQILMTNPAMSELSGYPAQELIGKNIAMFLPENLRTGHAKSMLAYFLTPRPSAMSAIDLNLQCRDGRLLPVGISLGEWRDEGTHHAIAYIRDVSDRKHHEELLTHKATHDDLTGLPNRMLFASELTQALARADANDTHVAVLQFDVDDFKVINDSFGHLIGDALLVQVGARIGKVLRMDDTLARFGGDEFAICLTHLASPAEGVAIAATLLESLQAAYQLCDEDVYAGGSLGLAFYPGDAQDSATLLRYADMAMHQSKQAGRGIYTCYQPEMKQRVNEDRRLHARLKVALADNLLQLHYQPQVDVYSGAIVGAEALLRWNDPVLGEVSPARFIPVAESTGLILPISDWVMETACRQIAAWTAAGMPMRVAVNVSAQQFRQQNLAENTRAVLLKTGAQAQFLDIEITESVAMTQPERAREQLNALIAMGCSVSLDDFGTGYSSLAYLKVLPVGKLKIDKTFMDGIPHDASDTSISKAIIVLAKSQGMLLVAEGVENATQLAFLQDNHCDMYQGWLFAKAMPAEDLTRMLAERAGLRT